MEKRNKNKKEEKKCPLCNISEKTLRTLKEKGKESRVKEKPQDYGK